MPRPREQLTYRLRRLPAYLERASVADFLVLSVEGLGPPENLVIFSLASNLIPSKQSPNKTATLMFKETPKRFNNDQTEWVISLPDQGQSLIFDTHFLGFTPLSDCDRDAHQFDCIAISGLASHPLGSWMQRDSENNFVWLRDRLPKDRPFIRPIIYGYDTQLVQSESVQTIDDLASSFIASLKSVGRASLSSKPLIIMAHSLGGIILRCALTQMAGSGDEEDYMLKSMKMMFFFGVPSKGMHNSHLLRMVEDQPNQSLVELLSSGSDYLSSLSQHFSNIATLHKIRLISAYETKRSRIPKKSEVGNWERNGPYELLVDPQSAVQIDSNRQDCFPINKDHSDMVKFSDDSPEYRIVIGFLDSILPVVSLDSSDGQGSSRPRKYKAQKGLYGRSSGFAADSSTSEPGPNAQPIPKKHRIGRVRKDEAKIKITWREATTQHESTEKQKNLKELKDSLDYAERSQRYERITKAHQTTFDWIFEKSELGLLPWLRKGTGIYWIQGKPGSGKSTLMKFLHDHPRTSEILCQWRPGLVHTSAWFFFNERGSYIEKSFEGLLRSVVREMISTNEGLAELVLKVYLERVKKSSKQQIWHIRDLEHALSAILSQREENLEVLLFLDALDEYSGPPEMIAEFVQSLVQPVPDSKTKFKLLISSRPWDAFIASLGQQPGFKIHEHTKSDMRIFVLDQLGTTQATAPSSTPAEASLNTTERDIASTIVDRAEGVFLWVRLVVKSLLDAGPNATTLHLKELLQALPNGLQELYERTIERIPQSSRLDAFIVLEIVNRANHDYNIREVTLAASCALGKTLEECVEIVQKRSLNIDNKKDALQLTNLCGGLIEVNRDPSWHDSVQFMHQTVKDFVSRPGFERRILGHSHAPLYENGFSFLMKYYLAIRGLALSSTRYQRSEFESKDLFYLARRAEETTGNSQEKFLDSIGEECVRSFFIGRLYREIATRPISVLSLAVKGTLLLYARQKLQNTTVVDRGSQKLLLHLAVHAISLDCPAFSLASMVELLLEKGGDINYRFDGETPFQCLCRLLLFENLNGRPLSDWSRMAEVVGVFLVHGQDANIDISNLTHKYGPNKRKFVCKPLHFARYEVSKALLEHAAQVNALDIEGMTALDHLIRFTMIRSDAYEIRTTASILLEYGGCITHSTKKFLPKFIEFVGQGCWEVPESFRNPPQLPMTLTRRVRSIMPSHLRGYMTLIIFDPSLD